MATQQGFCNGAQKTASAEKRRYVETITSKIRAILLSTRVNHETVRNFTELLE